jgi:hypothetical protein
LEEGYIKQVPRWFPGTRLNYAENLLWRADDAIAITEINETGHLSSYSYCELREQVRKLAAALNAHGLQPGKESQVRPSLSFSNFCTSCFIGLLTPRSYCCQQDNNRRYGFGFCEPWGYLYEYCDRYVSEGTSLYNFP